MRHVFISYAREDGDFAYVLQHRIESSEFRVWRDQALSAGEDWRVEIDTGIRQALATVVVLSPDSVESDYVNYEWSFSLGSGVPVVPVLLKAIDEGALHPRLRALRPLDFTGYSARPWDTLIESLRDLQDALRPTTIHVPRDAPPVLHQAVRELDSMDGNRRMAALRTLGQTSHNSAPEILAEAVRHPLPDVRITAAIPLSAYGDVRAIDGLLEGLRGRDERVGVGNLAGLGEAAVPALMEASVSADHYIRERAYWALQRIGGPRVTAIFIERLRDPDPDHRFRAADALDKSPESFPALLDLVHDPESRVRRAVISSLHTCAEKTGEWETVIPVLLDALDDEDDQVAISAATGLGKSSDPRAINPLLRIALTASSDTLRYVSRRALDSLGPIPAPTVREFARKGEAAVRARAIRLLADIGDDRDIPLFIEACHEDNSTVRMSGVDSLGSVRAAEGLPVLIQRLQEDDDEQIARSAVIALGRIRDASAIPALAACLQDAGVADLAADALQAIGTKEARAAAKAWHRQQAGN